MYDDHGARAKQAMRPSRSQRWCNANPHAPSTPHNSVSSGHDHAKNRHAMSRPVRAPASRSALHTRTYDFAPLLPPYADVRAVWVHGSGCARLRLTGPPPQLDLIERKHTLIRSRP